MVVTKVQVNVALVRLAPNNRPGDADLYARLMSAWNSRPRPGNKATITDPDDVRRLREVIGESLL